MFDTYIAIYRPEGIALNDVNGRPLSYVPVQIDRMSDTEMVAAKSVWAWHGKYGVTIYTYNPISIALKREDVLIDQRNIDPDSPTGSGFRYVIYAQPQSYIDHLKIVAEYIVGR